MQPQLLKPLYKLMQQKVGKFFLNEYSCSICTAVLLVISPDKVQALNWRGYNLQNVDKLTTITPWAMTDLDKSWEHWLRQLAHIPVLFSILAPYKFLMSFEVKHLLENVILSFLIFKISRTLCLLTIAWADACVLETPIANLRMGNFAGD